MVQTWVLRADLAPVEALRTGADRSVCGDCPLRAGVCYVNVGQAPRQVYEALRAGRYPAFGPRHRGLFRRRPLRLGAYGDPASVPRRVWEPLCRLSEFWTGYTHRWADCDQGLRRWLMASVDSPEEFRRARALGWRTFRTRLPEEPLLAGEFVCPKSAEAGHRLLCIQCRACDGGRWDGRGTPAIIAHGSFGRRQNYRRFRLSLALDGEAPNTGARGSREGVA
jgi:hypothetical protein